MTTVNERIKQMNVAFGNPEGDPKNIDWNRIRSQCKNILDEFRELQSALGLDYEVLSLIDHLRSVMMTAAYGKVEELDDVRDAICDIHVFAAGAHHLMGIDHDRDMNSVLDSLFTRFVKNDEDMCDTLEYHFKKGVKLVHFEGEYPTKIARSSADQPDAPKGKFLKSASYLQPSFYRVQ